MKLAARVVPRPVKVPEEELSALGFSRRLQAKVSIQQGRRDPQHPRRPRELLVAAEERVALVVMEEEVLLGAAAVVVVVACHRGAAFLRVGSWQIML
jgi:hypothetical protein